MGIYYVTAVDFLRDFSCEIPRKLHKLIPVLWGRADLTAPSTDIGFSPK